MARDNGRALLSKYKRERTTLQFWLMEHRSYAKWKRIQLGEEGEWAEVFLWLMHRILDLDYEIHKLEYHW